MARTTGKLHPFRLSAYDKAEMRQLGLSPDSIADIQKWLRHRHEMLKRLYEDTTQTNRRKKARRANAKPGYGHLEPKSKGYGARLPSVRAGKANAPRALSVGSRVTAVNVRNASGRVVNGVFSVTKVFPNGDRQVRNSGGLTYRLPTSNLRNARNALAPGRSVPVAAVTYIDKKKGDKKPVPYEHEFEGSKKPRLHFDGRNLNMKRAGSRYSVQRDSAGDYWIHD